ncbi:unnamed protein product [Rhodiola kirilowii]
MAHLTPSSAGEQIDLPPPPTPASSDSQRFIPTPFLTKTYQLVEDASINSIISWNEDGTSFVVWNPAEFSRDVLPKYFKHNNFSSFVRQLNTYGFRKVMTDRWEFSNECFRRGDKRLLRDIVRRKLTAAAAGSGGGSSSGLTVSAQQVPMDPSTSNSGEGVFSTNSFLSAVPSVSLFLDQGNCNSSNNNNNNGSSNIDAGSSSRADLVDENDRLKKENIQLCKELIHMKSMCTNIYSMMSNYNPGSGPVPGLGNGPGPPMPMLGAGGCGSSNSSQAESIMNPMHLLSGRRLLAAAVVETQAAQAAAAAAVIPSPQEDPSLNPRLFGFQLCSKRARVDEREDPMEQDDHLQLQQPGSSHSR